MKLVPRNNNLGFSLFDNMFDDMFRDPFFTNSNNTKLMKTDIQEKDNNYILDMDLPGYEKEDIKAQLKDGGMPKAGLDEVLLISDASDW